MQPPPALKIDYHKGIVRSKSITDVVMLMSEREENEHDRITVIRCATNPDTTRNGWAGMAWHPSATDPNVHLTLEFSNEHESWKRHVNRVEYLRMKFEYRARVEVFERQQVIETEQQEMEDAETQRVQRIKALIRLITRKLDDFEGAELNYDEEVKLLNEIRTLGAQVQELEEVLREEVSTSSEGAEFEDEGFYEMEEQGPLDSTCLRRDSAQPTPSESD